MSQKIARKIAVHSILLSTNSSFIIFNFAFNLNRQRIRTLIWLLNFLTISCLYQSLQLGKAIKNIFKCVVQSALKLIKESCIFKHILKK